MADMEQRPISIRAHDDGQDRWHMADAPAARALRGAIIGYSDYSEHTTSFAARRELASTQTVMILCLADPLEIIGADGQAIMLRAGEGFIGGFADATSLSRGLGPQAGVHVHMPWTTLAQIAGCPAGAIANRVVSLDDLAIVGAGDLGGRLVEANGPDRRFDLLDAFFGRRLVDAPVPDPVIAWAVRRLQADPDLRVDALARHCDWSRRHFIARFRDATGMTPGRFARLARFERFWSGLAADPSARLSDLAQDAGYHDEPHLARSVRDFADMTPGQLRLSIIPEGGGFAAG